MADDWDPVRKHGFERPFDTFQYVAAFGYALFTLGFAVMYAPLMAPSTWSHVAIPIFSVWIVLSLVSYVIAATVPVHDRALDTERRLEPLELERAAVPPKHYKCRPCGLIRPGTSKHCWLCGKCVENFDHHCKWLNHCVGERNYLHFAVFLSNTLVLLAMLTALSWYYAIEVCIDFDQFHRRTERAYNVNGKAATIVAAVFVWLLSVVQLAVVFVLGQLFLLHIELSIRGITTWDLIQIKRREANERRMERDLLGLPHGPPSPTCHTLTVWQRRRELGLDEAGAGEPSAYAVHDRDSEMVDRTGSEEPSLSGASSQNSAIDRGGSFRRTPSSLSRGGLASARGGGPTTPSGSRHIAMNPAGSQNGSGKEGVLSPTALRDLVSEDDEDPPDRLGGSCTSAGVVAGGSARRGRSQHLQSGDGQQHVERSFTPINHVALPHQRSMSGQALNNGTGDSPQAGMRMSPQQGGQSGSNMTSPNASESSPKGPGKKPPHII